MKFSLTLNKTHGQFVPKLVCCLADTGLRQNHRYLTSSLACYLKYLLDMFILNYVKVMYDTPKFTHPIQWQIQDFPFGCAEPLRAR